MITCLAIACTSRHSMVPMIRPFSGNATLFWKIFTFSLKAAYISHSIGVYRGFCDIGGAVMGVYAACYPRGRRGVPVSLISQRPRYGSRCYELRTALTRVL